MLNRDPSVHAHATAADRGHARVLLVDDEAALVRLIGRMLMTAGFDVTTATDGRMGDGILAEARFDAIVSDIDMPRMTGIQLLKAVRRRDLDVPVVLMTGNPNLSNAMEAIAHGALQYVVKPVDLDDLLKLVRRAVRLNRMTQLKRDTLALHREAGFGVADRTALEASFERALETLWMAYQPIVRACGRSLALRLRGARVPRRTRYPTLEPSLTRPSGSAGSTTSVAGSVPPPAHRCPRHLPDRSSSSTSTPTI